MSMCMATCLYVCSLCTGVHSGRRASNSLKQVQAVLAACGWCWETNHNPLQEHNALHNGELFVPTRLP